MSKEKKLYYIQNGYVGNDVLWWACNSQGYTTSIKNAGHYPYEEAMDIIGSIGKNYKAWECDYIDNNKEALVTVVDSQYLDSNYCITKK